MREKIRSFILLAAYGLFIGGCATADPIIAGKKCTQIRWDSSSEVVSVNKVLIGNVKALLEWPTPIYYGVYIKVPSEYQRNISSIELSRWDEWPITDTCKNTNTDNHKVCFTATPDLEAGKTAIIFHSNSKSSEIESDFEKISSYVSSKVIGCIE